jgi:hypothetical protein
MPARHAFAAALSSLSNSSATHRNDNRRSSSSSRGPLKDLQGTSHASTKSTVSS